MIEHSAEMLKGLKEGVVHRCETIFKKYGGNDSLNSLDRQGRIEEIKIRGDFQVSSLEDGIIS